MSKADQIKIGDRYGHWTVLKEREGDKVLCQCDCKDKTTKLVYVSLLLSGGSISCGCIKRKYNICVGDKYNHFTVLEVKSKKDSNGLYVHKCQCDCEDKTIRYLTTQNLVKGKPKSCGCANPHKTKIKHTGELRMYSIWGNMRSRCNNKNNRDYDIYGGRGIKCLWKTFEAFKEDMYDSYIEHTKKYGEENTTIDRIDSNKDYCKDNCRWATWKEQANNTSRNRYLTDIDGTTHTMAEWARIKGINYSALRTRINRQGWSDIEALNKPIRPIINKKECGDIGA